MRQYISAVFMIAIFTIITAGCRKTALIDARDFGRIRIDSIFPAKGPANSYFEVYGDNFTFLKEDVQVFLGSTELTVVNASVEKLLIKIPANATAGELKLHFNRDFRDNPHSGDAMDSVATSRLFELDPTATPIPALTSFTPATGGAGNTILVKGFNFTTLHDAQVWFGGVKSERLELTDTTMRVKVPAGVPEGPTTVYVEQNGQRSKVLPFTILKPLPVISTVYYTYGGLVYTAHLQDGIYTNTVLYDYDDNVSGAADIRADHKNNLLYWIDYNTASVLQAPMDGSGPVKTIYTYDPESYDNGPYKFELSGDKLYVGVFKNSGGISIIETDIHGGPVKELYNFSDTYPSYIRVSEKLGKIYWIDDKTLIAANMDGTGNKETILEVDASEEIAYCDLDDQQEKIYVRTSGLSTGIRKILQVSLSGDKTPVEIASGGSIGYILVDKAFGLLYWFDDIAGGTLFRTDTNASFLEKLGERLRGADSFIIDME